MMTREEFIGKLRSIYVGEENAIDEIISEYDRVNNISKELVEDIFTLLRVIDSNVKELKCSSQELKVINKYSYNSKGVNNNG